MAIDQNGNAIVTGEFSGLLDFGPTNITATGFPFSDVFVAKYDSAGALVWARQAGSYYNDYGKAVGVDASGNIYVTGSFDGNFSLGNVTLNSSGAWDIYVCKYNSHGTFVWARKAGGSNSDQGLAIAVSPQGDCFVTGYFSGMASFGVTNVSPSPGGYGIFVAKYNSTGDLQWVRHGGGDAGSPSGSHRGIAVAIDRSGDCYATGEFYGAVTFGQLRLTGRGNSDIFVCKFSSNGDLLWAREAGGGFGDSPAAIAVDGGGNCFLNGSFDSVFLIGGFTVNAVAGVERFLAKYDPQGNVEWAGRVGSARAGGPAAMAVNGAGRLFITGYFNNTGNFGNTNLSSNGGDDVFLANYDGAGVSAWAWRAGGMLSDFGSSVALDPSGNAYVTGAFFNSAEMGPTNLYSRGGSAFFLTKLNPAPDAPVIVTVPASQTVTIGSSAQFSVQATGVGPFHYQWQHNGTILQDSTDIALLVTNATFAQAGTYTVAITDAAGSTTQVSAVLTVSTMSFLPVVTVAGGVGRAYRIDFAESMSDTNTWQTFTNIILSSSPMVVVDTTAPIPSRRFYRVVLLPP